MVKIDYVKFGELKVDGHVFYSDMIVWWDGEKEFVEKSHVLDFMIFSKLLRKKPDSIVVGTGQQGMVRISDDVKTICKEKGIRLFVDTSEKAVDVYNGLIATGKKAVAFIHTTC